MGSSYTPRKPTIVTVGLKPELAKALEPVKQSIEMLTGARVGTPELYGLPQKTSGMALIGKVNEIIARLNASGAYKLQKETSEGVMADVGMQKDDLGKIIDAKIASVEAQVSGLATQLAALSQQVDALSAKLTTASASIVTINGQISELSGYVTTLRRDVDALMGTK